MKACPSVLQGRVLTRAGRGSWPMPGFKSLGRPHRIPVTSPPTGLRPPVPAPNKLALQLDAKEPRVEGEPSCEPRSLRATQHPPFGPSPSLCVSCPTQLTPQRALGVRTASPLPPPPRTLGVQACSRRGCKPSPASEPRTPAEACLPWRQTASPSSVARWSKAWGLEPSLSADPSCPFLLCSLKQVTVPL